MGFQESTKRKPKKFELLQHYPMSWRYIVRSNLGWLLVFATVLIFYILLWGGEAEQIAKSDLALKKAVVLAGTGAVLLVRLLYAELYRRTYSYRIEDNNLVISRGILIKEAVTIPLLRVTEVYKKRTFRDFLLGLAYLSVSTATETSSRFAKIEGLSLAAASGLQRTILEMALKVQDPEQNQ